MRDLEQISKLSKAAILLLMLMESNDSKMPTVVDFVKCAGYVPRSYYNAKKELEDFMANRDKTEG